MAEPETRVAIVEDEPNDCGWLRRSVEGWPGFRCCGIFRDAETALRQLPRCDPDLAIVDLGLPRMDGIRCIWRLKEALPGCEVLVHSIETRTRQVFQAIQAGASGYVIKGATPEQLREAVQILLAGGAVLSPSIARMVVQRMQERPIGMAHPLPLSQRESEVLALLVRGYRNDEVARELAIAADTVKSHVRKIYQTLQVHSRAEVIAWWHGQREPH